MNRVQALPLLLSVAVASALAQPSLAVDLFVKPNGGGTACTQASPCTLATALATMANDDTIYLAAGTYTGSGAQVVLLDRSGIRLLGGWDAAPSGAVKRDPVGYETVLDGEQSRRVVKVTQSSVTIDGCTICNGDASGTGAECGGGSTVACGGGIFVTGSGATISACRIVGNTADTATPAGWVIGKGGGIMGYYAHGITIVDNVIAGNAGSVLSPGQGGGLSLVGGSYTRIGRNRIVDNTATLDPTESAWGGGVSLEDYGSFAVVEDNLFQGNRVKPGGSTQGNALFTWYQRATVRRNRFESDEAGTAVFLGFFEGSFSQNHVVSGDEWTTIAIIDGLGDGATLTNNVLVAGAGATRVVHADGYDEKPLTVTLEHNTIVGNGASTGLYVGSYASVSAVNTIIARNLTAIHTESDASVTPDHTLFWDNDDDGIRGTSAVDGDPAFVNPPAGDFHISEGSAAADAGIDAGVASDLEGDARPGIGGVDIGADEMAPRWFDFGTPASPLQWQATQVTHLTTYSPERGYGWLSGNIASRDRGGPDDLYRDFCFTQLGTFAVDLPNGRYWVTVVVGDATHAHSQMGIFLEGTLATTLSSAANEFLTPRLPVSVTDGQLTVLLDDLGGGDVNVVINSLLVERALRVALDLGTAGSPLYADYQQISHTSTYSPQAGAGWLGGIIQSRDRGGSDDLLRDLDFTQRGLFGVFLENGTYDVTLTLGDSAGTHDQMGVSVQGATPASITATKNQFVTRRWRTCVADNRLEVLLDDLGGNDVNVVVNAIEVAPPPPSKFDFGTPTSNVEPGWVQVSEKTQYADGKGYGWSAGAVASRDRGTGTRLRRDLNFSRDAVFSVDVLDGTYAVTVTVGDAASGHDRVGLRFEGVLMDDITVAKGVFRQTTYSVQVTDGTLDVAIEDLGGSDVNAVINALEIR